MEPPSRGSIVPRGAAVGNEPFAATLPVAGEPTNRWVAAIAHPGVPNNHAGMPELPITSRQNPRVKRAVQLRQHRWRRREGRLLIDGSREIARALDAGVVPLEVYHSQPPTKCDSELIARLAANGSDILPVSPPVFEKLAFGDRRQGLVVVGAVPDRRLADIQMPANALVLIVEGIEKPGNLGAIIRTADAAGVDAVCVVAGQTDMWNPNTIRASVGTVFRPNVCEADRAQVADWVRRNQLQLLATRPDADELLFDVELTGPVAILLGNEAAGLTDAWPEAHRVRLPMHGISDSLNVSATAAVALYEAVRQRN